MKQKDQQNSPKWKGEDIVNRWHSTYMFMPLFEKPVKMPELSTFLDALKKYFGRIEPLHASPQMPQSASELLGFALMDHMAYYKKTNEYFPSQLMIFGADKFDQEIWDKMICANFSACIDKEAFLPRCKYAITAANMMAAMLHRMEEYGIMATYADMILEVFPDCIGIYWPHSQSLTPREYYEEPHWHNARYHFLDGGLNVRFFRLQGTDEMLFDTLGLTAIGLTDLQFHCKNLEPDEVVVFLRNLASYLYEYGDIIEDGNTVEGIHHEHWICQREGSMAEPRRTVLDINPGAFAGGNRS